MSENKLELLAPVGKKEALKVVIANGANAVYLGGKRFNMRLLRPDYNFSDAEMREAVSLAHDNGVKVYVTVNNLYFQRELNELSDYLLWLQEIGCDALIIQDLAVVQLINKLGIKIPLHASVQMGVANLEAVRVMEKLGLSRVILSKNVALDEIREIHGATSIGIEYFVHGDLCISHPGQCYMSSFAFGESGNRGRCRKPCRWRYEFHPEKHNYSGSHYFLAHKDLCLANHLAGLAEAGVTSFKVEGRMRDAEFVGFLIQAYRRALDAVKTNNLQVGAEVENELFNRRVRDFTTGSLYGRPGSKSIGYIGEREPFFPTSPIELVHLTRNDYPVVQTEKASSVPRLNVKVGGISAFKRMLDRQVDSLVIGGDRFRNREGWTPSSLRQAIQLGLDHNVPVVMETPRVVAQGDIGRVRELLGMPELKGLLAVIVNDLGSFKAAQDNGLPVWAGYGLNTSNAAAAELLLGLGFKQVTASMELKFSDLKAMVARSAPGVEVVVQGPLCGMITDYCPIHSTRGDEGNCAGICRGEEYYLQDEYGQKFRILTDEECRSHIFYPYELCLFGYLPLMQQMGVHSIRIEGQHYRQDILSEVVDLYRWALREIEQGAWDGQKAYRRILRLFPNGLTHYPLMYRGGGLAAED